MATKTKKSAPKAPKKIEVDFYDEDSVKAEIARALDVDPDDLSISEAKNLSSFGVDTVYLVELGSKEYYVVRDDEVEHDLAVAIVKQDLEHEPTIFNQSFIESHIDLEHLRKELMSDVQNMRYEDLKEEAEKRPERFLDDNGLEWPMPSDKDIRDAARSKLEDATDGGPIAESDVEAKFAEMKADLNAEELWAEIGDEPEVKDSDIEKLAEEQAEEQLRDPVAYLEDIYGKEDAIKQAIKIGGIDEDAAADEAVSSDGAGHFLSSYDGNTETTPGKLVYWRHN